MSAMVEKLVRRIKAVELRESDVLTAMQNQVSRVRIRTASGHDVSGYPFLKKRDGSPSYLFKTGNLMRSLQADAFTGDSGLLGKITVVGSARKRLGTDE